MEQLLDIWPVLVGLVTVVVALAKMHNEISNLKDKVKTLFELHNRKD